jgi:hypothetical protein
LSRGGGSIIECSKEESIRVPDTEGVVGERNRHPSLKAGVRDLRLMLIEEVPVRAHARAWLLWVR